ncbi:MAG: galactose oxidase [Actinobacteria bacterium]|nr:galactose oxidase [Actinomycetota bacterium]
MPAGLVYEYDPAEDTWVKRDPMPQPCHHAAMAALDGAIYLCGGFELPDGDEPAWKPTDRVWRYDPAADTWHALASLATARGAACAAAANGKVYVMGGAAQLPDDPSAGIHPVRPHRSLATVEEYDPATDTWREVAPLPTARNHAAAASVGGRMIVIGGRLAGAFITALPGNTGIVEEYDPQTDSWSRRSPMPTARSGMAVAVHDGRVYVAGGEVQTEEYLASFRAFEMYDVRTDTWHRLPHLPVPRHGLAASAVGGRMHFVSGDLQSAIVPRPNGVVVHTDVHHAFEPG